MSLFFLDFSFLSRNNYFNIVILGDTNVGKTTLLYRYTENVYRCTVATIAAVSSSHTVELGPNVHVKLNIWDTCGMERYRAMTRNYYRNAAGCLLVFDLTNRASFRKIKEWHDDMCASSDKVVFVLVGQKCDDTLNRRVNREEAELLANNWECPYVETSAVTGENVNQVFDDLARRMKDEGILSRPLPFKLCIFE
uniref:Uncharacterized protein n=1 Tax=Neogobius melanostomus TaxID=47308 RepID=A0A8C6TI70_9GOBI